MEENKVCFVVTLIDGTKMAFDCQCDNIDQSGDNLCLFLHKAHSDYKLLAAIPYNQIRYIKRVEVVIE